MVTFFVSQSSDSLNSEWFNPLYLQDKNSGNPPKTHYYIDEVLMPQLMVTFSPLSSFRLTMKGHGDEISTCCCVGRRYNNLPPLHEVLNSSNQVTGNKHPLTGRALPS